MDNCQCGGSNQCYAENQLTLGCLDVYFFSIRLCRYQLPEFSLVRLDSWREDNLKHQTIRRNRYLFQAWGRLAGRSRYLGRPESL